MLNVLNTTWALMLGIFLLQLGNGLQGTLLDALDGSGGNTPVAAVVLASDGAATGTAPDSDWWRELAERGIPVHAVAVGEAAVEDDSALIDVDIAHELIAGVSNEVRLHITHPTTLESMHMRVESASGDLLYASTLDLPGDQAESAHVIRLAVDEPGTRELVFRLLPERLDRVANNNSQSRLVSVVKRPQRVLYVEGEPRWEYKFIRRALASSDAVDIVSLLRTSDHKFYRQGVADAEELAAGLPTTAAAWNRYDAIIIGNLAAASFTGEQQKQLRDYVSERGGSLLMIGGRDTLADGGWSRSLTAAALPVLLDGDVDAVESANRDRASWQARITLKGRRQQWLDISTGRADAPPESDVPLGDGEGSALTRPGESTSAVFGEDATDTAADAGWSDLPALANRQSVGVPRTGAEVLLDALLDDRQEPLLVWHRYGRGTAAVLGTAGTWRWQMGLSHLDQRHERFWQQLLGELTARARPQLDIRNSADVLRDGEAAEIQVVAYDDEFQPLAEPALAATLVRPDGREEQLGLAASADRPGVYGATVPAEEAGPWGVRVALPEGKAGSGALTRERWWMRDALGGERFATRLDSGFLEAIADATGGSFRHIDNIDGLESALVLANAAERHERTLPLWNMPALFLLLLALKLGEWLLRLKWNRL